jgi:hypothetical protein
MAIQRALHTSRELQDSGAARWPRRRCDELREALIEIAAAPWLGVDGHSLVVSAIAELRESRENNDQAGVWIRVLVEFLLRAQHRVREILAEN